MVQEKRLREGIVYNQPVGELEVGESIFTATKREVKEETGYDIDLVKYLGTYVWLLENGRTSIRMCFVGKVIGGSLQKESWDDDELIVPKWFNRDELEVLSHRFRNPVTHKCLEDYYAGKSYPLSVVTHINEAI